MTRSEAGARGRRHTRRRIIATAAGLCCATALTACSAGTNQVDLSSAATTTNTASGHTSPAPTVPAQTPAAPPAEADQVIGAWRSVKDPTDVRMFNADGTSTDQVGNDAPWLTRWDWVSTASVPSGVPSTFSGPVLRLTDAHAATPPRAEDVYYYSVTFDDPDTLVLVYFNGLGRVLKYTRVR